MKERIALVCQRYGKEVLGGAELYCRQLAEKLLEVYDVTVYSTCALDYVTWKNHYPAGVERIDGVRVKRYPNEKERKMRRFAPLHKAILDGAVLTDKEEERWIIEQGPYCPKLIRALCEEHDRYRAVIFMTSLYYTTVRGMLRGFRNAFLIPTVHDEAPNSLRIYDRVFNNAKGIFWNTFEEKAYANRRFPETDAIPGVVAGAGIDGPAGALPALPAELRGKRYVTYAGRIDEEKGCVEMIRYFRRFRRETGSDLKLVLMGRPVIKIPKDPDIISLGFVPEEMKFAVMKEAFALLLFSRLESLSIVVLESMYMGRPVIVSEYCDVLRGHCVRSNAGLYFKSYREFRAVLEYLLSHPGEYEVMCRNGIRYVEENYRWDVIVGKYRDLIGRVMGTDCSAVD